MGDGGRLSCALLTRYHFEFAPAIALLSPGLDFVALDPRSLGLAESPNPFGLREEDKVDAVLVASSWYDWLEAKHAERVSDVMRNVERCADAVLGFDCVDQFALGLPPRALERFAAVIKTQGVYRDRDLYNYEVGARYPGANWTAKRRPLTTSYRSSDLDKIRVSVPCYLVDHPAVRRASRAREAIPAPVALARGVAELLLDHTLAVAPIRTRRHQVHCAVALTHAQRIDALDRLQGFSGKRGITRIRERVSGADGQRVRAAGYADTTPDTVMERLVGAARPHMLAGVGRLHYQFDLVRHQIVVAPTGYGELSFRHAEAWRAGAALVCQDLSHVEMQLPIHDRENAAFCKPDLTDLRATVEELLADSELRCAIAQNGRHAFRDWWSGWRDHLRDGIETPVRDALGR